MVTVVSRYCGEMADSHSVQMSSGGLPTTVLPQEDGALLGALANAATSADPHTELGLIVASNPRSLFGWAAMGRVGRTTLESYAYYRVGYHRGLDALRQNGWRGSGYVRWSESSNRGFLRCLSGLAQCAAAIGEADEAQRCSLFLQQLDPGGVPTDE